MGSFNSPGKKYFKKSPSKAADLVKTFAVANIMWPLLSLACVNQSVNGVLGKRKNV